MVTEKTIRDAYIRIRTIDHTIPDEVLDFMLYASIQQLNLKKTAKEYCNQIISKPNNDEIH